MITLECTECRQNEEKRSNGVSRYLTQKIEEILLTNLKFQNIVVTVINIQFIKKLRNEK
jgi:hypothetical protein